jgi:hypothetical protein
VQASRDRLNAVACGVIVEQCHARAERSDACIGSLVL